MDSLDETSIECPLLPPHVYEKERASKLLLWLVITTYCLLMIGGMAWAASAGELDPGRQRGSLLVWERKRKEKEGHYSFWHPGGVGACFLGYLCFLLFNSLFEQKTGKKAKKNRRAALLSVLFVTSVFRMFFNHGSRG